MDHTFSVRPHTKPGGVKLNPLLCHIPAGKELGFSRAFPSLTAFAEHQNVASILGHIV
jgi:hypothetical protein